MKFPYFSPKIKRSGTQLLDGCLIFAIKWHDSRTQFSAPSVCRWAKLAGITWLGLPSFRVRVISV